MAKRGNKNAVGNKGGGRPTSYRPEHTDMAFGIALLGATDADLARIFDVGEATIGRWKGEHPEFLSALKAGKDEADGLVAKSLYQRALGYKHMAVKIMAHEGVSFEHEYEEHYPPDTTACIFWLKNRQPAKWRDKQEIDHRTPDGPLIQVYVPGNGRD